ncbi:MAG: hypothetical protein LBG48_02250, partial [Rickettsiales bacterium]|nr:hypothetical protein [Rickettsiales bacterium]
MDELPNFAEVSNKGRLYAEYTNGERGRSRRRVFFLFNSERAFGEANKYSFPGIDESGFGDGTKMGKRQYPLFIEYSCYTRKIEKIDIDIEKFLSKRAYANFGLDEKTEVEPLVLAFKNKQQDILLKDRISPNLGSAINAILEQTEGMPPYVICPLCVPAKVLGQDDNHEVGLVISKTDERINVDIFNSSSSQKDSIIERFVANEIGTILGYKEISMELNIVQLNKDNDMQGDTKHCTFFIMGFIMEASKCCNVEEI